MAGAGTGLGAGETARETAASAPARPGGSPGMAPARPGLARELRRALPGDGILGRIEPLLPVDAAKAIGEDVSRRAGPSMRCGCTFSPSLHGWPRGAADNGLGTITDTGSFTQFNTDLAKM